MDPAFLRAVREAGEILAADPRQAVFLKTLAEEQEELKELQKRLGGGRDDQAGPGGSGSVR